MTLTSKTFRIFISSTFKDLKEERNALQKEVFPKLRELCMQNGYRFQAIDLRWGVRDESALDQQTMKICLEEVARCQRPPHPNFIVLLGDRYGWCPLPAEIPADEYEAILGKIENPKEKEQLIKWYKRDDNALPPVYCLQPRRIRYNEKATVEERLESTELERLIWEKEEASLQRTFRKVITHIPFTKEQKIKYGSSATEQEVIAGAFNVPNAREHVFGFFREIEGLPMDERAEDYLDLIRVGDKIIPDDEAAERMISLKKQLVNQVGKENIFAYGAKWEDQTVEPDSKSLCDILYSRLAEVIKSEIRTLEERSALEKEIEVHADFCVDRARNFTGRAGILEKMGNYINGKTGHPLVIQGASGSGKSALIAKAIQNHIAVDPVFRFIGASPGSTDGRTLLESLCQQISNRMDVDASDLPGDYNGLSDEFERRLELAGPEKPLLLFLDALDQLSDTNNARNLSWLPAKLPPYVHIVVSTLPGECANVLVEKLPGSQILILDPMPVKEGEELLDIWLSEAHRTLQFLQKKEILEKFKLSGLPLYLKLAFEEARKWKSYTEEVNLEPNTQGILNALFDRLSKDENHGAMMVSRSLGYLAAAKNGLTEDELIEVLSNDKEVYDDFTQRAHYEPPEPKIPMVIWSRLYFDLEPYLAEREADGTSLMTFYHPTSFGAAVRSRYLNHETKVIRHKGLKDYFESESLYHGTGRKETPNLRKLSELPFQQRSSENWKKVYSTLTDLLFIDAKCRANKVFELLIDYNETLDVLPEAIDEKKKKDKSEKLTNKYIKDLITFADGKITKLEIVPVEEYRRSDNIGIHKSYLTSSKNRLFQIRAFHDFVQSHAHDLQKFGNIPGFCLQEAFNYARSGPVDSKAKKAINTKTQYKYLLKTPEQRKLFRSQVSNYRTIDGASCVSITPDGQKAISGRGNRWSETITGNDLKLWNLKTGKLLFNLTGHTEKVSGLSTDGKVKDVAVAHSGSIWAVKITPDGKRALSGSNDRTLKFWNLENGECLKTFKNRAIVKGLDITPNGRKAVTVSGKSINVWDLEKGELLKILQGHSKSVTNVCLTSDGQKIISVSEDKSIRVWSIETGKCQKILEGHTGKIKSISVTPMGKFAATGGHDKTVRVWDLEKNECLAIFEGHSEIIQCVDISPDGKRVVSAGNDMTIRVWDIKLKTCIEKLIGHTAWINSIAITIDGSCAVSAAFDDRIRLWNLNSGGYPDSEERHNARVI